MTRLLGFTPKNGNRSGDTMPMYHDGKWHIFILDPTPGRWLMPVPSVDSNKAAFLARVRGALGRAEPTTVVPDYAPLKATLPRHQEKILTLKARLEARAEASKHTLID